ncbi:MAG TPA: D-alanine--D-alanine ligase [bacterium]|nr:D-alanine--D-alanine ligase [bacterium]
MKIIVLAGGKSPERDVSLMSGKQVYNALKRKNYSVILLDPSKKTFLKKLIEFKPDCVFIVLHGGKGENGVIQGTLETLNIPYTGSGVLSSAMCMNKIITKKFLKFHKIPTPPFVVVEKNKKFHLPFSFPVVVKPANLGSTIGIRIVKKEKELKKAVKECFNLDNDVFIEKFIEGKEITIGILGNEKIRVLPAIEIRTKTGFYDYKAKYTPGESQHIIPPEIPEKFLKNAYNNAKKVYKIMRCSGFARMEIMINKNGVPYILDVNTIPGMTKTSLLPDAAKYAGINFDDLCEQILNYAIEKWKKKQKEE